MSYNQIPNIDKSNTSNQTTTLLVITLHKAKLLQTSSSPASYTISLSFNNSSQEQTDKISTHLHTFPQTNNTFQFKTNLHSLSQSQSVLHVQATTTWFLFNTTLAQITIPITLININSQRQWFYLKNEKDENVVGVLISFTCDDLHKLKPLMSPSANKTEISIRYGSNNYSTHYSTNTHNYHNVSVIDRQPQLTNEYKRKSTFNSASHINSGINDNCGVIEQSFSGVRSNSNNNIIVNHHNMLNCNNNILTVNVLFELLANKRKALSEMEDKTKIHQLNNNIANDRVKDNEKILNKENTKLLDRIRKSKIQQNDYETKTINLTQNALKFDKVMQRELVINDILSFNNEMNLQLSNVYNYAYNCYHLPLKTMCIPEPHVTKNVKTHQLSSPMLAINKREISAISTSSHNNLHIETFSSGNFKQKPPNAILDHNSLLYHNKSSKNQRQDPAKKSNSTYMTTTQNTSEASFNDYLINKPPMISQIYLNTSGTNNDINTNNNANSNSNNNPNNNNNNVIKDNLDCATNKKVIRRKTIANHSYLNYSNLMSNGNIINNVNVNLIDTNSNNTNTIRKNSVKGKTATKGESNTNNNNNNNINNIPSSSNNNIHNNNNNSNNNPTNNRCKKRKQTVISLTSHKPLNTIYNNGQNTVGLCLGTNQCSTTRKSKKHISLKKI